MRGHNRWERPFCLSALNGPFARFRNPTDLESHALLPSFHILFPFGGACFSSRFIRRHGSSQPGPNTRSVLVGSLSVTGRDPWQRFVGVWRLWGLFSRSVRYIADKRLHSSGVDTIPAPDPEPEKEEAEVVGGEGDAEDSLAGMAEF